MELALDELVASVIETKAGAADDELDTDVEAEGEATEAAAEESAE